MKDLDAAMFLSVFYEMLGPVLWVLLALAALVLMGMVGVMVRDRGLSARRLVWAEVAGVLGGFGAVMFMQAITSSRLADVGGPIDVIVIALIWIAGAIGTTMVVYLLQSLRPPSPVDR